MSEKLDKWAEVLTPFVAQHAPKMAASIDDGLKKAGLDGLSERENMIVSLLAAQIIAMTIGMVKEL